MTEDSISRINYELACGITAQRKKMKMTQQQLADRITETSGREVTPSIVSSWERGVVLIPAAFVPLICQALNCSSYALYPTSAVYTPDDMQLLASVKSLPQRIKQIINYMLHTWQGDIEAFWEFGLLYFVLPKYRREYIARAGIETYKEGISANDANIDRRMDVNLPLITKAWKALNK